MISSLIPETVNNPPRNDYREIINQFTYEWEEISIQASEPGFSWEG